jgi:uncharacterized protein YdhG (YjbR/CyaY superfamily)
MVASLDLADDRGGVLKSSGLQRTGRCLENPYKVTFPRPATKQRFGSIDEYLETFPEGVREILQKVRQTIRNATPESVEAISYGIPTFKLDGRNLVHFAGWKNHVGFYPTPSMTKAFGKELSRFKGGKGSRQFPLDETIPFDLIRRMVVARVREIKSQRQIKNTSKV